jgi:hypothetical protein
MLTDLLSRTFFAIPSNNFRFMPKASIEANTIAGIAPGFQ